LTLGEFFMPGERLETILLNLLRRYAPSVRMSTDDLPALADTLAANHALVIVGEAAASPDSDSVEAAHRWAGSYMALYNLLAGALFPALHEAHPVQAYYADDQWPAVAVMTGEVVSVITALAGLVVPFIAARQSETRISEAELTGLMEYVLEELEAHDLPREEYRRLRDEGAALLRGLLTTPIRQIALTRAQRPLFNDTSSAPPITSDQKETTPAPPEPETAAAPGQSEVGQPLPPPDLPEMPVPESKASETPQTTDPIYFGPTTQRKGKRPPPLPPLPDEPKSKKG
jgi:hypothetical protein